MRNEQHLLTDSEVVEIRSLYESTKNLQNGEENKWTFRKLATKYKISRQSISNIIHRRTYQWVE